MLIKCINSWTKMFQNFKSVHIYMKSAEFVETKEKSIFQFQVSEMWSFLYSWLVNFSIDFEYKIVHNSKKIIWNFIFLSFQLIAPWPDYSPKDNLPNGRRTICPWIFIFCKSLQIYRSTAKKHNTIGADKFKLRK